MKNPPPVPLPNNTTDDNDLFGQVEESHNHTLKIPDGRAKEMLKTKSSYLLKQSSRKISWLPIV